eukprot:gene6065-4354_t
MPFLSRRNDSCAIRGDVIQWLETLPSPAVEALDEEVWFLFPYVSSINATHRFLLGETAVEDSWRTIYDMITTGNERGLASPGEHGDWRSNRTRAQEQEQEQEQELTALGLYAAMDVQSHMISESLAYVYICVPPEQYAVARWFVSYWKELYPLSYGLVFIRYRIIPLAEENHHATTDTNSRIDDDGDDPLRSTTLSSRSCWREVARFVFAETGEYDLVIMLRGLPALLSFVPPSAHAYSSMAACQKAATTAAVPSSFNLQHIGFIPFVDGSCGRHCYFCPLATIVLGAAVDDADVATATSSVIPSTVLMFSQVFRHFHHLLRHRTAHEDETDDAKQLRSAKPLDSRTSEATFAQNFHGTLTRITERFPTMVHVDKRQQNFATWIAHDLLRDIRAILFTASPKPDDADADADADDVDAAVMQLCTAYGQQRHPAMTLYCEMVFLYARRATAIPTLLHDHYSSVSWQPLRERAIALVTLQRSEIHALAACLIHYETVPDLLLVITAMRRVHSVSSPPNATSYQPMLQVVTYGTEMNEGLDALLMSSIVSGVPLEIVGLNASWTNFSDLIAGIRGYLATHHLSSSSSSSTVTVEDNGSDEDIVVVVDAYDILLLPSMRRLVVDTVATAATPLRALMRRPIYAIHGNNKASNTLYAFYAEQIATATQQYLSDPWREDLLQLLWAWYDGDVTMVDRYLQQFDAIRSSTTRLDGTMQSNGVVPLSTFGQEVIRTISQCRDMFATSLV